MIALTAHNGNAGGLARSYDEAWRDGFSGYWQYKPPAQAEVINQVFPPGEAEIASARRVVELLEANTG
jgi:citrate lyase beta subunit